MTNERGTRNERDWSIQEVARLAGTTSRALRHYGDIGLLPPSSVGANGYRRYAQDALVRLQRILLLRELGLGLPAIAEVLDGEHNDTAALAAHLRWLESERDRVTAQIASVATTIERLRGGEHLMAEEMLNGFDHTVHREEVERRWGADAYAVGDAWWSGKSAEQKALWQSEQKALAADWADAAAGSGGPLGERARALARRQYDALAAVPGTPGYPQGPTKEYFAGLGELYAADARFAANYGGASAAAFVRDAMAAYAEREL